MLTPTIEKRGKLIEVAAPEGFRLASGTHYLTFDRADYPNALAWSQDAKRTARDGCEPCPASCACREVR